MGNWQLEVFRMALYISFPVGVFHYFNQPENFEEYVVKVKETPRAQVSRADEEDLRKHIAAFNEKYQKEHIEEMEKKWKEKQMSQTN